MAKAKPKTKKAPAKKKARVQRKQAAPAVELPPVDLMAPSQRVYTDDQAQPGTFVQVVSGPHRGRYGVFHSIGDEHAGWPVTAVVRTRDAEDENLLVDYGDLRPSEAGHR